MDKKLKEIIDESQRIVFFGGAGVSTESNIPDFRSEAGLYNAVSSIWAATRNYAVPHFFMHDMETFFDYYKNNLVYLDAKPNKAHEALAKLEKEGKLLAVVTQNIDGLHQKAGSKNVFELHGSVNRNYCMKCGTFHDVEYVVNSEGVPKCKKCGGVVKPDVVLYEESLDSDCIEGAVNAISKADTLIIGGTSLAVYPAAGFINYFRGKHLVVINKTPTMQDKNADLVINDSIGKVMEY